MQKAFSAWYTDADKKVQYLSDCRQKEGSLSYKEKPHKTQNCLIVLKFSLWWFLMIQSPNNIVMIKPDNLYGNLFYLVYDTTSSNFVDQNVATVLRKHSKG